MLSRLFLPLATALLLMLACTQSEADACGKGTVYRDGACHPESQSGAAGTNATSNDGGNTGEAGQPDAIDPDFGQDCAENTDCSGSTNYCVPMSPFDTTYCSVSGCDVDPNICPPGWTCFDVSRFVPGEPWVCTRPTD